MNIRKLTLTSNIFIILLLIAGIFAVIKPFHSMEEMRDNFISDKNQIIGDLITKGDYSCCLEKPCTYCIEKSSKHGEGATCTCLEDVVNGVHPCGECIGEIMEGHGNPYLAEYFPKALAEEMGEQYLDVLTQMIKDKYDTI